LITSYPWPLDHDGGGEFTLALEHRREYRLLIVPALFDEANRLRRFAVEVMRRLDAAGIDAFLIDLPGCNESLAPLRDQSIELWRAAAASAAQHFGATHVLGMRGGALLLPPDAACADRRIARGGGEREPGGSARSGIDRRP
jgi:hypothetical protein